MGEKEVCAQCEGNDLVGPLKRASSVFINDPSAGSPTETLLRLLLPLNDQVRPTSQRLGAIAGSQKPIRRPH